MKKDFSLIKKLRYARLVEIAYSYENLQRDLEKALFGSRARVAQIKNKYPDEDLGFPTGGK